MPVTLTILIYRIKHLKLKGASLFGSGNTPVIKMGQWEQSETDYAALRKERL
jgi:hypothetical protein